MISIERRWQAPGWSCSGIVDAEPVEAAATTIGFVGDMMLGRGVAEALGRDTPEEFFGDLLGPLRACGGVVGNLESPITEHAVPWSAGWKSFRYRTSAAAIGLLEAANIRAVSLANNHVLDFGAAGLMDTRRHLAGNGIAFAGAGATAGEATAPAICRIGQVTLGLIALTDNMPEWRATERRPGIHYAPINGRCDMSATLRGMTEDLRSRGADCVILSVHWGWLPVPLVGPPRRFRRFARQAIDAGVDIVHGHSAHLLQGIERYGRGVIFYDTGNFLDDYWVFPGIRIDRSVLCMVEFVGPRPRRLTAIPVSRTRCRARRARGEEFLAITRHIESRSRRLGTTLRWTEDGAALELSGAD